MGASLHSLDESCHSSLPTWEAGTEAEISLQHVSLLAREYELGMVLALQALGSFVSFLLLNNILEKRRFPVTNSIKNISLEQKEQGVARYFRKHRDGRESKELPEVTTQSLCSLNNCPNCEVQNLVQENRPEEKWQQLALRFPGDKNASSDKVWPTCNSA